MSNYKEILETLGYKLKDHGKYWRTNAVYRSGDNSTALQVYKDSGVWKDYVEDSIFLPFEALIQKTLNTNDKILINSYLKQDGVNLNNIHRKKILLSEEKKYDTSCLSKLLPHFDFYLEKGISRSTLNDFKCGLAMSGKMYQRIVFPIFASDKKIHGFSGRKVVDDSRPKWLHNGRASDWFYPFYSIDQVQQSIIEQKSVHIVESIGDCISLYENGVKNVLVSFGLNISPKFISKLNTLDLKKIFISFNNDFDSEYNRGFEGSIKSIFKLMDAVDFETIYFAPPAKNDFGEMCEQDVEKHIEYCNNLQHKDSILSAIDFAETIKDRVKHKNFQDNLKKIKKTYNFHYE